MKAVARAHDWYERIVAGKIHAIGQIAQESSLTRTYIMRILQCMRRSPQVIEALLTGKHPSNLSLKLILDGVPIPWREQEHKFLGYLENRS